MTVTEAALLASPLVAVALFLALVALVFLLVLPLGRPWPDQLELVDPAATGVAAHRNAVGLLAMHLCLDAGHHDEPVSACLGCLDLAEVYLLERLLDTDGYPPPVPSPPPICPCAQCHG